MEEEKEIITLDDDVNERYMLVNETVQGGVKYYLAAKVDENDTPTLESLIFEEVIENNERYMILVKDEERYNSLAAIFISDFNQMVDEEE